MSATSDFISVNIIYCLVLIAFKNVYKLCPDAELKYSSH